MFQLFFAALIAGIIVSVILGAVIAIPVMLLWDWVVPSLFGLPEITYFQAWGLYILCVILFQSKVETKK
jgi:hypothetical protein